MALIQTPQKKAHFHAPDFKLTGTDDRTYSYNDIKGENGTLIMFICNHCPYVIGVIDRLVPTCRALQEKGIGCAAIMANDTENYPADSFDNMKRFAQEHGFTFPYLIDETQEVARAYGAVCTPDFFGFDAGDVLQYRGRLDSAGKDEAGPDTEPELFEAMSAVASGQPLLSEQFPSMGCSIKWRD